MDHILCVALSSTSPGTLTVTADPTSNEVSYEVANPPPIPVSGGNPPDNRTGVGLGDAVGSELLTCTVGHVSASIPSVVWIRNGQSITADDDHRIETTSPPGIVNSTLEITSFAQSDVGEYQCIFIDADAETEVITTIPLRLDTGCLLYTSPSPRDATLSRMPSSA